MTSSMTSRTRTTHLLTRACALGATTALVLLTAACGGDDDDVAAPEPTPAPIAATGTLNAANQTGNGNALIIKKVSISGAPGWIALHKDNKGEPGEVVGFVAIPEGESTNVKVKGDKKLAAGTYWPMLHQDDGTVGTYEFGESEGAADAPVVVDGKPVMKKVVYTRG